MARVVTLNLWGILGDWAARRRVITRGLRELRPDLVAFVEALKTDDYDQVADLFGPDFHVAHQAAREPDGQGASIASRWPISACTTSVCYRDAWESAHPGEPGETFTPRNPLVYDWGWPFRRLDYVLVRCASTSRSTACGRATTSASSPTSSLPRDAAV